jgi:NADH-quinone oxidoreductase subunit J
MGIEKILFYLFALMAVTSALGVITSRNPVHAVLFLVLTFFTVAVLWLLLQAEFLAILLILVYVGAVMVLFLFVVMMLDINLAILREGFASFLPLAFIVAVAMLVQLLALLLSGVYPEVTPTNLTAEASNTKALGQVLYTVYVYPFEIAAVILLLAIVAAISLTLRRRPGTKHQDVGQQVRVRRADRVRMIAHPDAKTVVFEEKNPPAAAPSEHHH